MRFFWSALPCLQRAGQDEGASTQGQDFEAAGPRARIVHVHQDARNVKEQKQKKKERAQESSRESRMFPDDHRRARDNQGSAGEIRPEGPSRKPRRTDPNGKFLVDEMLNAERHDGQGEKISPDSEERNRRFALVFQGSSAGKHPGAPAHRQGHKSTRPLVSTPRVSGNSRNMQRYNEKKEQDSQQNSRRSRHFRDDGSDCGRDEGDAYKVRPKQPARYPPRHQRRNEIGIQEMLNPENYQGNGDENPSG